MNIETATWYRLFAGGSSARRPLARWSMLVLCVLLLAGLGYKVVQPFGLQLDGPPIGAVWLWTSLWATLLALFADGYQRGSLQRLRPLLLLPLGQARLKSLYMVAFLPLLLITLVMGVVLSDVLLASPADRWPVMGMATGGLLVACVANIALQLMACISNRIGSLAVQMLRSGFIGTAAWVLWSLISIDSPPSWAVSMVAFLITLQSLPILLFCCLKVSVPGDAATTVVHQLGRLGLVTSFWLRAIRSRRYRSASGLLLLVATGLSLVAWRQPAVLPFDGVAFFVLLLAGTFGQESRSLAERHYPVELVLYGLVSRWVAAFWGLAVLSAVVVAGVLLAVAVGAFPGSLSVSYIYVVDMSVVYAALGLVAGSIVVPQRDDVMRQLASTMLYGGFIWGVLRLLQVGGSPDASTAYRAYMVIAGCLLVSWVAERARWLKTIRGTYG